jgi:hypothetical protein
MRSRASPIAWAMRGTTVLGTLPGRLGEVLQQRWTLAAQEPRVASPSSYTLIIILVRHTWPSQTRDWPAARKLSVDDASWRVYGVHCLVSEVAARIYSAERSLGDGSWDSPSAIKLDWGTLLPGTSGGCAPSSRPTAPIKPNIGIVFLMRALERVVDVTEHRLSRLVFEASPGDILKSCRVQNTKTLCFFPRYARKVRRFLQGATERPGLFPRVLSA